MRRRSKQRKAKSTRKRGKKGGSNGSNGSNKSATTFKNLQCSPNPENKKDYSCLDDTTLFKLKELWNLRHSDAKIVSNNPKDIWSQIKVYLKNVCNKESCWLKQQFVQGKLDKELRNSFAPKSPEEWKKKPNEWLSSVDILDVMKQYERAYKCFEFMGPSPIDFDTKMYGSECVWPELCKFSLKEQIASGKTKIGIIFNTDTHDKGGEHWLSMFINIKKKDIFVFDSAGDMPDKEIQVLIDRIVKQGTQLAIPITFKVDYNYPVEHQLGSSACGMYSLYFIVHMLEDKLTGHYLKTHTIRDKFVDKFRKIYFNEDI
jgi:hypothetical protein